MVHGCGINAWESNSQIVHIVADNPLGPFSRKEVVAPGNKQVLVNFVRLCCFGDTLTGVCQSEHPINTEWSAHLISVPLEVALSFYGIYADKRAYNSDDSPVFAHEPGVQRGPDGEWVSYACNGSELAACVCIKGILWTQSMA